MQQLCLRSLALAPRHRYGTKFPKAKEYPELGIYPGAAHVGTNVGGNKLTTDAAPNRFFLSFFKLTHPPSDHTVGPPPGSTRFQGAPLAPLNAGS